MANFLNWSDLATVIIVGLFIVAIMIYQRMITKQKFIPITSLEQKQARIEPEQTRDDAKTNTRIGKREKQKKAKRIMPLLWIGWLGLSLGLSYSVYSLSQYTLPENYQSFLFLLMPLLLILGLTIGFGLTVVHQMEEFTIELFGKWFTTWETGWHILFPFIMTISGKVYVIMTQMTALYMDGQEREGILEAQVNFTDATSSVIAQVFYQIFSSDRAVYAVEDVLRATREKIDAGLRAYFGTKTLDKAIQKKSEITLDDIIPLSPTQAEVFKAWGVELMGIAVTDIGIPTLIKEQRDRVLTAEKDLEVATVKVKTAEKEGEAIKVKQEKVGSAAGKEIKKLQDDSGLKNPELAAEYLLNTKYFAAIEKNKGVIIAGKGTGAPLMGAEFAASLSLVSDQFKEKSGQSEEKPEKKQPEKIKEKK